MAIMILPIYLRFRLDNTFYREIKNGVGHYIYIRIISRGGKVKRNNSPLSIFGFLSDTGFLIEKPLGQCPRKMRYFSAAGRGRAGKMARGR